jgi:tRNA/tmRNA/rRNA uracil-C5-methylase (TrmA/RlmC/RlmD family)
MPSAIKYIVDDSGQKTTVLVPIKEWESLNENYRKLQSKLKVITSIRKGIQEVKQSRKSGKKMETLKEFLK